MQVAVAQRIQNKAIAIIELKALLQPGEVDRVGREVVNFDLEKSLQDLKVKQAKEL